jgi:hypothetical protein
MSTDDNFLTKAKDDFLGDDDKQTNDNAFYADDVQAQALADNNMDPDTLKVDDDIPVTSGDMKIGDLDLDKEEERGDNESYDEESVPAGDNVSD